MNAFDEACIAPNVPRLENSSPALRCPASGRPDTALTSRVIKSLTSATSSLTQRSFSAELVSVGGEQALHLSGSRLRNSLPKFKFFGAWLVVAVSPQSPTCVRIWSGGAIKSLLGFTISGKREGRSEALASHLEQERTLQPRGRESNRQLRYGQRKGCRARRLLCTSLLSYYPCAHRAPQRTNLSSSPVSDRPC